VELQNSTKSIEVALSKSDGESLKSLIPCIAIPLHKPLSFSSQFRN
jgi:hypothetical protein